MYTYTQLKKLASTLEERVASFSSLKNNFLKLSVEISARLSTHGLEFLKHYLTQWMTKYAGMKDELLLLVNGELKHSYQTEDLNFIHRRPIDAKMYKGQLSICSVDGITYEASQSVESNAALESKMNKIQDMVDAVQTNLYRWNDDLDKGFCSLEKTIKDIGATAKLDTAIRSAEEIKVTFPTGCGYPSLSIMRSQVSASVTRKSILSNNIQDPKILRNKLNKKRNAKSILPDDDEDDVFESTKGAIRKLPSVVEERCESISEMKRQIGVDPQLMAKNRIQAEKERNGEMDEDEIEELYVVVDQQVGVGGGAAALGDGAETTTESGKPPMAQRTQLVNEIAGPEKTKTESDVIIEHFGELSGPPTCVLLSEVPVCMEVVCGYGDCASTVLLWAELHRLPNGFALGCKQSSDSILKLVQTLLWNEKSLLCCPCTLCSGTRKVRDGGEVTFKQGELVLSDKLLLHSADSSLQLIKAASDRRVVKKFLSRCKYFRVICDIDPTVLTMFECIQPLFSKELATIQSLGGVMAQSVVVMLSLVSSMVQCIQAKGSSEFNISSMDLFGFGHFLEVAFKYLHQNVVKLHNPDAGLRINTRCSYLDGLGVSMLLKYGSGCVNLSGNSLFSAAIISNITEHILASTLVMENCCITDINLSNNGMIHNHSPSLSEVVQLINLLLEIPNLQVLDLSWCCEFRSLDVIALARYMENGAHDCISIGCSSLHLLRMRQKMRELCWSLVKYGLMKRRLHWHLPPLQKVIMRGYWNRVPGVLSSVHACDGISSQLLVGPEDSSFDGIHAVDLVCATDGENWLYEPRYLLANSVVISEIKSS